MWGCLVVVCLVGRLPLGFVVGWGGVVFWVRVVLGGRRPCWGCGCLCLICVGGAGVGVFVWWCGFVARCVRCVWALGWVVGAGWVGRGAPFFGCPGRWSLRRAFGSGAFWVSCGGVGVLGVFVSVVWVAGCVRLGGGVASVGVCRVRVLVGCFGFGVLSVVARWLSLSVSLWWGLVLFLGGLGACVSARSFVAAAFRLLGSGCGGLSVRVLASSVFSLWGWAGALWWWGGAVSVGCVLACSGGVWGAFACPGGPVVGPVVAGVFPSAVVVSGAWSGGSGAFWAAGSGSLFPWGAGGVWRSAGGRWRSVFGVCVSLLFCGLSGVVVALWVLSGVGSWGSFFPAGVSSGGWWFLCPWSCLAGLADRSGLCAVWGVLSVVGCGVLCGSSAGGWLLAVGGGFLASIGSVCGVFAALFWFVLPVAGWSGLGLLGGGFWGV